jgi:hypothetical protein
MDFELERGNEAFNFGGAVGYYFVELRDAFHDGDAGFAEAGGEVIASVVVG